MKRLNHFKLKPEAHLSSNTIDRYQQVPFCGQEKEGCVGKQTKGEKCLVPCSGLYADVSDDSLEQTMMEGDIINGIFITISMLSTQDSVSWLRARLTSQSSNIWFPPPERTKKPLLGNTSNTKKTM